MLNTVYQCRTLTRKVNIAWFLHPPPPPLHLLSPPEQCSVVYGGHLPHYPSPPTLLASCEIADNRPNHIICHTGHCYQLLTETASQSGTIFQILGGGGRILYTPHSGKAPYHPLPPSSFPHLVNVILWNQWKSLFAYSASIAHSKRRGRNGPFLFLNQRIVYYVF
jgi:hypothetical protein